MAIQSTGLGSNLDINSIISKLMQVEQQPLKTLAKKEASFQAKLSAYGTLNSAVSSFQSALTSLNNPSTFQTLSASSSDSTIAFATANSTAVAGSYNLNVTKLAQAQAISSAGVVSTSDAIGSGTTTTINFQFGKITGTATNGTYSGASFAQDPNQNTGSITINSNNNTLQGIRDTINTGNFGVSASIVGDGSATPYHLVLTSAKTGETSSMKITVAPGGDSAVSNLLSYDPAGTQKFTEVTTGQNANLTLNGINISNASNTITNSIQGASITVSKIGSTSISISPNTSGIQTGVTNFVKAYNDLNGTIKTLTAYDAKTQKAGLLIGDSTAQSIQNQVRRTLSAAVNGLGGGITTLSQIGISFQKDGTLAVDSGKLNTALTTNFKDVGGLFASLGATSDSLISIAGSSSATQAGSFPLSVSQIATKGNLQSDLVLELPTTTIADNNSINVTLDGVTSVVNLTGGTYTPSALATMLQSAINSNATFTAAGSSTTISLSGGALNIQSNKYGSVSNISLSNNTGTSLSKLTTAVTNGTAGLDVIASLNGISKTGTGQLLTGTNATATEGLQLIIAGGSTGDRGTVNFSIGYASSLSKLVTGFLGTTGTIQSSTTGITKNITDIGKQRDSINSRLFDVEARYRAQFTALDKTVSSLNNISAFLTQQLSALNGSNTK
jgi:flagellar hook-associated protein 2